MIIVIDIVVDATEHDDHFATTLPELYATMRSNRKSECQRTGVNRLNRYQ
jgi:hypothetical protein